MFENTQTQTKEMKMRIFGTAIALALAVLGLATTSAFAADCGFMPGPGVNNGLEFPVAGAGSLKSVTCTNTSKGQATATFQNNRKKVSAQIISLAAGVPKVTVTTVGFDVNNGQIFCTASVSGGPGPKKEVECQSLEFTNRWRSKISVP